MNPQNIGELELGFHSITRRTETQYAHIIVNSILVRLNALGQKEAIWYNHHANENVTAESLAQMTHGVHTLTYDENGQLLSDFYRSSDLVPAWSEERRFYFGDKEFTLEGELAEGETQTVFSNCIVIDHRDGKTRYFYIIDSEERLLFYKSFYANSQIAAVERLTNEWLEGQMRNVLRTQEFYANGQLKTARLVCKQDDYYYGHETRYKKDGTEKRFSLTKRYGKGKAETVTIVW